MSGYRPVVPAATESSAEPVLIAGMGASYGVSAEEVRALLDVALGQLGLDASAVTAIATVDAKAREPGLVALAGALEVPLVPHPAAELTRVPHPGLAAGVLAAIPNGATPSVAEAAALLGLPGWRASHPGAAVELLVGKTASPRASVALARHWVADLRHHGDAELIADAEPVGKAGPSGKTEPTGKAGHSGKTELTGKTEPAGEPEPADPAGRLRDFAVNVCTDPLPAWLAEAITAACGQLASYPRPQAATAAAAARHRRLAGEVLLTAGASEAFTLLAQGIPAGLAAVVHPQFTEPEVALRAAGWRVHRVLTDPDDGWALHPDRVPDSADLVVIGNPTNPTGTLHPRQALLALRRPGRLVVIDEAFADAVPGEPESLADAADLTGVVVVRSLTKTWGLAGLRIGYLLGDPAAVAAAAAVQPHWSVSGPALAAAEVCLADAALAEAHRRALAVTAHRRALVTELTRRGFEVPVDGVGPFLLARHPHRPRLHAELRTRGFAVRRADTFPGLGPGWIRIAVRDPDTTAPLLAALDLLAGKG